MFRQCVLFPTLIVLSMMILLLFTVEYFFGLLAEWTAKASHMLWRGVKYLSEV